MKTRQHTVVIKQGIKEEIGSSRSAHWMMEQKTRTLAERIWYWMEQYTKDTRARIRADLERYHA